MACRFATGTLARVVSDDLVTWPLGPGAHGSTHVARLAPHGTLEYSSFNQLKGCAPLALALALALPTCTVGPQNVAAAGHVCWASRYRYNSAGNNFRDGAVMPIQGVWMSLELYWIVRLGVFPFTFIFGVESQAPLQ